MTCISEENVHTQITMIFFVIDLSLTSLDLVHVCVRGGGYNYILRSTNSINKDRERNYFFIWAITLQRVFSIIVVFRTHIIDFKNIFPEISTYLLDLSLVSLFYQAMSLVEIIKIFDYRQYFLCTHTKSNPISNPLVFSCHQCSQHRLTVGPQKQNSHCLSSEASKTSKSRLQNVMCLSATGSTFMTESSWDG